MTFFNVGNFTLRSKQHNIYIYHKDEDTEQLEVFSKMKKYWDIFLSSRCRYVVFHIHHFLLIKTKGITAFLFPLAQRIK